MRMFPQAPFVILALILAGFNTVQAQTSIPIEVTDQGHILLEAEINDVKGDFILDTGAGLNVITKDFASQIDGLVQSDGGYTAFRATGERIDTNLHGGNNVEIEGVSLKKSDIGIIDMDWPIDGIISLMGFRDRPFTIDFGNKKLHLETDESLAERKEKGRVVPIQLEDSREKALDTFTYIRVNDSLTLQTSLDSGAGRNVFRFNAKYMSALDVDTVDVACSRERGVFDRSQENTFCEAALEKMALRKHPEVKIEDFEMTFVSGLIYDAIVDIHWLGDQVTFDLDRREMVVQ